MPLAGRALYAGNALLRYGGVSEVGAVQFFGWAVPATGSKKPAAWAGWGRRGKGHIEFGTLPNPSPSGYQLCAMLSDHPVTCQATSSA